MKGRQNTKQKNTQVYSSVPVWKVFLVHHRVWSSNMWALTPWRRLHGFSIQAQPLDERILCLVRWLAELHWLVWHHHSSASISRDWRWMFCPRLELGIIFTSYHQHGLKMLLNLHFGWCHHRIIGAVRCKCWVLRVGEQGKAAALRTGLRQHKFSQISAPMCRHWPKCLWRVSWHWPVRRHNTGKRTAAGLNRITLLPLVLRTDSSYFPLQDTQGHVHHRFYLVFPAEDR